MDAGRELDVLVAEKVMGWIERNDGIGWLKDVGGGEFEIASYYFVPSIDIARAFEVVERMRGLGYDMTIETDNRREKQWWCAFYEVNAEEILWFADAETAPLAICKAALKALEG